MPEKPASRLRGHEPSHDDMVPEYERKASSAKRESICAENFRGNLLESADQETIEVLTSRIGDHDSACIVVRVARAAEAWMREDTRFIQQTGVNPAKLSLQSPRPEDETINCFFYGEKRPKIALDRYLGRLVRYLDSFSEDVPGPDSMGILCLLGACVLIDRIASRNRFDLDAMNTHRMFMIAVLVAFKVLDDEPCSNEYYSGVGGVELAELNHLEIQFLKTLDFTDVSVRGAEIKACMNEFAGKTATRDAFNKFFETSMGVLQL